MLNFPINGLLSLPHVAGLIYLPQKSKLKLLFAKAKFMIILVELPLTTIFAKVIINWNGTNVLF